MSNKDIALILNGWEYNPNEVTVRKVLGIDGREKIQMRLDLGVLQMEVSGRPDGQRPNGFDSLLEYQVNSRDRYRDLHGGDDGFTLSEDDCNDLRQESMQYYYRYLSLFHLQDYLNVIRDTERNLSLFDFMKEYAEEDSDRASLDQFRPYVMMMNTRARACLALERRDFDRSLELISEGIEQIEQFLRDSDRFDQLERCREILFLQEWSERIRSNRPISDEERLRRELRNAVEAENYERAAELRDEINAMAV